MQSVEQSPFYPSVLKELHFPFGKFYLFEKFVIAEVDEGVTFSWTHAKLVIEEVTDFYDQTDGSNLIYITNRINKYDVKPVDWLKFFMHTFSLKGYAVVTDSRIGTQNAKLESLFMKSKFKTFQSLLDAVQWAAALHDELVKSS